MGDDILDKGKYVIGHSVGEISALTVASALEIEDAARLTVCKRFHFQFY